MLVKLSCTDDRILFKASIDSINEVVDKIYILSTQGVDGMNDLHDILGTHTGIDILQVPDDFIKTYGFAEARNILLDLVSEGDHVLWVDSDEVFFPEQLLVLKEKILPDYDDTSTHFIHFCLSTRFYEHFEKRVNIFRKTQGTRWEGKVHEKVVHEDGLRRLFNSSLLYHHYGYCRNQSLIAENWKQYTSLEGDNPERIDQEYPDGQCLDHRKNSLIPYFGEYPSTLPPEWVASKLINI